MTNNGLVDVLLVEDSKHDAMLALLALGENNLTNNIIWLKDGKQALDFLFGEGEFKEREVSLHPKVVLLDLKMPKVDGLEVLKEIRGNPLTKNIPVVVLTSSKEDKDIIRSYELGVNSFIVKPVDFDQFTRCVKEIGYYWSLINQPPSKT
ncbi:response regulator [uncultured Imperialibacter sp.]|uniref:response regulator n=1 Tax=uncultured Imperialibacter sp. TaxID=1672639 RepID=UPI0030DA4BBA|tara:strand:- start:9792 stop:10241 length:450 start_codon:yes stop_codon:yes gene_type:complete